MEVVHCKHIGFATETVVTYKNKEVRTNGLSVEQLVEKWRKEYNLYGINYKFVLALPQKEYQFIHQGTIHNTLSVIRLLEEQQVYCICIDDIEEIERLKEENEKLNKLRDLEIQSAVNIFKENERLINEYNELLLLVEEKKQQAIKDFAEKLKAKLDEQKHFYEVAKIGYKDISLTALNTTYKMLDDLLKEYGEKV